MSKLSKDSGESAQSGTSLAHHAAINLVGGFFTPAASFAAGPIIAHALSVDGRGELAAATMPLTLTVTLATIGLPEAVTYYVAQDHRRTRMLMTHASVLTLIPAAVATALLILSASWISDGNLAVRRLIMLSAFFIAPSLLLALVRALAAAHNRWVAITIERMTTAICRLVPLVILFVTGELHLANAAIVTMISTLTGIIAYLPLLALRKIEPGPEVVTSKQVVTYGSGIWIGSIAGILLMRIDQVLLSPLSGTFQLGLYAVAVSISELPLIVNGAIRETAFTHLSSRGVRPDEIGDLSRISTISVSAMCVPVGALAPILIPPLFGHDFSASVPVVFVLLIAILIGNPGSIAGVGLSSAGYPHLRSISLVLACIVNVALVLMLTPSFGAVGAAVATLLGNITSSNMSIAWMIMKCDAKISDYYRFRPSDFVKFWHLLRRGLRRLTHRIGTRRRE